MRKYLIVALSASMFAYGSVAAEKGGTGAGKAASAQASDNSDLASVSGMVVVSKDRKSGQVTDLELMTSGGFKFKIIRDSESKYLESKNNESVELTGLISQKDGYKWVAIKKPVAMAPVDDTVGGGKGGGKHGKKQEQEQAKKQQQEKKQKGKKVNFDY